MSFLFRAKVETCPRKFKKKGFTVPELLANDYSDSTCLKISTEVSSGWMRKVIPPSTPNPSLVVGLTTADSVRTSDPEDEGPDTKDEMEGRGALLRRTESFSPPTVPPLFLWEGSSSTTYRLRPLTSIPRLIT